MPRRAVLALLLAAQQRPFGLAFWRNWGRPVGLLQLPDGSLLESDDGGNRIWRVSYKG